MTEPPLPAVSTAERPPEDAVPGAASASAAPAGPSSGPSGAQRSLAAQRVIPLRHPGRWIATLVALVLAAQFAHGLVSNPFYQWDRFGYWFLRPVLLRGLVITLEVTALSAVLGLLGGIVLAVCRLSKNPVLRGLSWLYIWLFRSIPLIVILLILFNFGALYRTLSLGVPFGPEFFRFDESKLAGELVVATVGLSLSEAAYAAEVVRSGVLSVDQGQHEAAAALGLPKGYQFRRIVLPQALRAIVPTYVNQLIGLIKGTSLVFYVSLLDLFGEVETMGSTYPGDVVPLLLVATIWYVILTSLVSIVQFYVERYYSRGALRTIPPTPVQRLRAGLRRLRERADLGTVTG
ncbi:amino acid ABC transporter permease [Streptacidiphilus sp. N1-3]|uniref:Amino acid ABC transporter permease n=1 Tax=Streptacidiphilus alkalitolerans TaxID=3342712 RepID=A0ABV6X8W7_9ACTN